MPAGPTEQSTNTSGGMDPISAIANAVGSVFNAIGNIIQSKNIKQTAETNLLAQSMPDYKDLFADTKDNSLTIIIGILSFVILFVVGAIIYIQIKRNKN